MNRKQKQTVAFRIALTILVLSYLAVFLLIAPGLAALCRRLPW